MTTFDDTENQEPAQAGGSEGGQSQQDEGQRDQGQQDQGGRYEPDYGLREGDEGETKRG